MKRPRIRNGNARGGGVSRLADSCSISLAIASDDCFAFVVVVLSKFLHFFRHSQSQSQFELKFKSVFVSIHHQPIFLFSTRRGPSVRPQLTFDELENDFSNAEIDALIRRSILTLPQPPLAPSYNFKDRLSVFKSFIQSNLFVKQLLPSILATVTASAMMCVLFSSGASSTTTAVSMYQPKTLLSTKVSAVYSVLLTTITLATLFFLHECVQYYTGTLEKCWTFQHSLDNLLAQVVILASSRRSVFFQTGISSRLSSSAQVVLQDVCTLDQLLQILVYASVVDELKVLCSNRKNIMMT